MQYYVICHLLARALPQPVSETRENTDRNVCFQMICELSTAVKMLIWLNPFILCYSLTFKKKDRNSALQVWWKPIYIKNKALKIILVVSLGSQGFLSASIESIYGLFYIKKNLLEYLLSY